MKFYLLLSLLFASTAYGQTTLPAVQAYPSDSFVDSMGVNVHLPYTNTAYYNSFPRVLYLLQQLSIRHVRDNYFNPSWGPPLPGNHKQLTLSRIYADYVLPNTYNPVPSASTIGQLQSVAGDVEAVEYPNECDAANCGGSTQASSIAAMKAFAPTMLGIGSTQNLPVFGPSLAAPSNATLVGNMEPEMTYGNLHAYFAGHNPGSSGWGNPDAQGHAYGSIPYWLDQVAIDSPGDPVIVTETGYLNFATPSAGSIPADVEATYLLRTFALFYMAGVKRTYVYEFLDETNSPGYGIVDSSLNPKPAYTALKNMISQVFDPGATFVPQPLHYTLTGGDSTVKQLLFQKHDGSYWLLLWLEQSGYNPNTSTYTSVAPQTVTLTLAAPYFVPNIGVFDTSGNLNFITTGSVNQTYSTVLTDRITMVKILDH